MLDKKPKEMTHMTPREEIGYGLDALVIFRSLQQDPVLRALMQFCHTDKENTPAQIRFYSAMVSALYERADDLTGYLNRSFWNTKTFMSSVPVPAKPFLRTWKPVCTQN